MYAESCSANVGLDREPGFELEYDSLALPTAGEWEDEQQLHSVEDGVGGLFDSDGGLEVVELIGLHEIRTSSRY